MCQIADVMFNIEQLQTKVEMITEQLTAHFELERRRLVTVRDLVPYEDTDTVQRMGLLIAMEASRRNMTPMWRGYNGKYGKARVYEYATLIEMIRSLLAGE